MYQLYTHTHTISPIYLWDFNKLANMIIGAGKSKICTSRLLGWIETQGQADVAGWVQKLSPREFPFAQGRAVFCYILQLIGRGPPTLWRAIYFT